MKRVFLIVLDSLGIGEMPDAGLYGDEGSNTLRSVCAQRFCETPNLQMLGLYNIDGVDCYDRCPAPKASFARMTEASAGKDTIIGHWEIGGIISPVPMPLYPGGFPAEIIQALEKRFGRKILCNKPYSGTQVLLDYGREHMATGSPIVYTSADSVLQIAAHEEVIPPDRLYDLCQKAREIMTGTHGVGRIIARPFVGKYPDYTRTANRHDFARKPPDKTILDYLSDAGYDTIGVGKIHDIFAGMGVKKTIRAKGNTDGMNHTISLLGQDFEGLCFVNLVDFDMLYGHRNDPRGYAKALTDFDRWLDNCIPLLQPEDVVILTADHGCDPATESTDHSREYTPMVIFGVPVVPGKNLGTRASFADIAATIADYFGIEHHMSGQSFWPLVKKQS